MSHLMCESYDVIAIWKNGQWDEVGTGYGGELNGDNPLLKIRRSSYYDWFDNKTIARQFIRYLNKYENLPEGYEELKEWYKR